MNPETREQVRSNALYLRGVRPVDPEEIHEYVEGTPHPAVVRQVLREGALGLGLVERDDGTFVPVPDEPIEPGFRGVERFPEAYGARLDELLAERYGPEWERGESGDRLREVIRRTKEGYFAGDPVEYDADAALGYAIYHLPDYYAAVQYVLAELVEKGLLPKDLRVLEVGAGTGGPALGINDFVPEDALVEYHAVEPSANADVLAAMLAETAGNFHPTIHRTTAEAFEPASIPEPRSGGSPDPSKSGGEYDLLLFANVLSELDDPVAVVRKYLDHLAHDGSLVAVSPADLNTSTGLREIEREFDDEYTVYSPTVRFWPGERPTDRGWSFDVKPDLEVPSFQRRLDRAGGDTGEFVNVDVQYSHFVLRTDGVRRREFTANPGRSARMAEMERHVTDRIDIAAAKLSHDLSEGGHPVFKVSDGSESVGHFAVLTKETALNAALRTAGYGDVLAFENVLVLWNDDEGAYNLVVDEGTVVDRIPA